MEHLEQEIWRSKMWCTAHRIYTADLKKNLFGEWVVVRHWSGRGKKGGQSRTDYVESYDAGIALLGHIEKTRLKRGYIEEKVF